MELRDARLDESFTCISLKKMAVTSMPLKSSVAFSISSSELLFSLVTFWTEFTLTVSNEVGERPFCPCVVYLYTLM